jgi:hypothetical protein
METGSDWEENMRKILSWVALIATALFGMAIFLFIISAGSVGFWDGVALKHLPAVIGLPAAAAAALCIVLLLRTVAGNIELKLLGMEFKGASGPIIMWVLCFLSIALAINKTWNLKD